MRFALPKNRTAPLILFAILGIIVSITLGLYHMNRMTQYSYKSQCEDYDSLTDNAVALLKQEIDYTYQSLQASANFVASTGNLDKNTIDALATYLMINDSYVDISIVDENGRGYNSSEDELNLSKEEYYQNAMKGQSNASDQMVDTSDHTPATIYAVPIESDGVRQGVLVAKVSAQIENITLLNNEIEKGCLIYLVNEDNEIVAYVKGTDISGFNYDKLILEEKLTQSHINDAAFMGIDNLFQEQNIAEDTYIWNKKPLGVNNWSLLVGSKYTINTTTRDILKLTNLMWIIVTLATLFLFLLMIITQRRSNRKVVNMLYLDPVTGGDNWYKFRINVNKILNSKQFNKKKYAIINFDINRFKIINDAYGYQKGDEVLKDIYNVIKKWTRASEPFTRYAADQFYILMSFLEEDELVERINDLNERLHQLRYTKTARIFYGVYHITERKDSIDRMGEFAGIAKSNIKGSAETMISFFDDVTRGRLLEEEEIEKSMNEALKNDEFHVYLQPKYMAKEETISGAEALVRWHNGSGTLLSPGYFIPIFEKNGFITELDFYMLKKVCELIRSWIDKEYTPLPISVNISRLHFANSHLAEIITEIVDSYEVPHHLIELELTESAFLQNKQMLIDAVIRLRQYGFLISMDDFGAGYSSLNSLKDLPLDVVKLDGELFRLTDEVERGLCVIRNTITMAKDLHMKVVAECIETKEQVEFLCTVGCDIIQGYYFAKPMPVDQFEQRYFSLQEID